MITTSIVVPTLTKKNHLSKLFASLQTQTCHFPVEVIVCGTNMNTDNLIKTLPTLPQNFHLHLSNSTEDGIGKARNKGLSLARGQFVLFLDDDCLLPDAHYLQRVTDLLLNKENAGWCGSYIVNDPQNSFASAFYNYMSHIWLMSFKKANTLSIVIGGCAAFSKQWLLNCNAKFRENDTKAAEEYFFVQQLLKHNTPIFYNSDMDVFHHPQCTFYSLLKKSWHHGRSLKEYPPSNRRTRIQAYGIFFKDNPIHSITFFPLLLLFLSVGRIAYWRQRFWQ